EEEMDQPCQDRVVQRCDEASANPLVLRGAHGGTIPPAVASPSPARSVNNRLGSLAWQSFFVQRRRRVPRLLEFNQGGMQSRLHGPDRDSKDVRDFSIFQPLIISQNEDLSQKLWQLVYSGPDQLFTLLPLGHRYRAR